MAEHQNIAEWHGKDLVDRDGQKIGKLEDVYVDVETDEPMFGTVKVGLVGRHLTFVPLAGITIGPDNLEVTVSREQVKSAPNIELHGDGSPRRTSKPSTTTTSSTTPPRNRTRSPARPPLTLACKRRRRALRRAERSSGAFGAKPPRGDEQPADPSLGPSREIDDEHDEQNDDQKANQSVTGSSNGEHGASL
jgi:hypothetical protein